MTTHDEVALAYRSAATGTSFAESGLPDSAKADYEQAVREIDWFDEHGLPVACTKEWSDASDEVLDSLYRPWTPEEVTALESGGMAKQAEVTLVSKAIAEDRFTLGPMYIPNQLDAHNEWTDPDELQKAVWEYMRKGDRRIRLQHNRDIVAGEALEVMAWPYPVDVPMVAKDGSTRPTTFPPNTVFLGVQWEPWAWELVKADKIRGYSIGGKAQRLLVDLGETE